MRHDLLLRRDQTVLILVDMQERLMGVVHEAERILRNASKLVQAARILGLPILVTEHNAPVFGETLPRLRQDLQDYAPMHKMVFSCLGSDEFRGKLKEIDRPQVLIAGIETHICVCQTALDALKEGYQVHVAHDATSSRSEDNRRVGLEKLGRAGVIASSTEMAIYEWLERAGTDEFRKVLPLIKS